MDDLQGMSLPKVCDAWQVTLAIKAVAEGGGDRDRRRLGSVSLSKAVKQPLKPTDAISLPQGINRAIAPLERYS